MVGSFNNDYTSVYNNIEANLFYATRRKDSKLITEVEQVFQNVKENSIPVDITKKTGFFVDMKEKFMYSLWIKLLAAGRFACFRDPPIPMPAKSPEI